MEKALLFIEENQTWIYFILLFGMLIYLRLSLIRANQYRKAMFGLERERSLSKLTQSGAMLVLTFALGVATFVVANFVAPAYLANVNTTPDGEVDLLSTQEAEAASGDVLPQETIAILEALPEIGCPDPNVNLVVPQDGSTVSGVIEVRGTATHTAFGFYQFHYRLVSPGSSWNVVAAGDEPKIDDVLGIWDTTWLLAGEYYFRLVVTDTAGVPAPECVIRVRVVPSP
ncbi:MAG TPA: hypothetical protein G4O08_01255 [Anaerolineae bacterium]|nr:hypothetical protein [Anaerolineae bacterium]